METQSTTSVAKSQRSTGIRLSGRLVFAVVAVWGLLVVSGLFGLWNYGAISGDAEAPPAMWPTQSQIARKSGPTLLLFAHPLCPCSRASLAELARLVAACHDRVDTHVLLIAPREMEAAWRDSDLYSEARAIPGVTVEADVNRCEARLFRARTSGICLLYGSDGKLLFQGGITPSRGHEGDNYGSRSIVSMLSGENAESNATPVFGCPLFENEITSIEPESSSK
jgi:hypothetical protein